MLSHERVWAAIDALAARYSLSASGLAKRAGLDSTAFNKSKRQSADGRPRWPSTESLAKIIEATNSSLDEFMALVEGRAGTREKPAQASSVPLLGFAQAGAGGFFDDAGFPVGQGFDLIELICVDLAHHIFLSLSPILPCLSARLWENIRQEFHRVDKLPVRTQLEMQVRPGGFAS